MKNYLKTLASLIDNCYRKQLLFVFLGMMCAMLVELVGVGSLFPYIKVVSDPKIIHSNKYLAGIFQHFHFSNDMYFLIFMGLIIFLMILIKALLSLLNNYLQISLSVSLKNNISSKLLSSYLSMRYDYFTGKSSTELSKHVLYDVDNAVANVSAILNMISNVLVASSLLFLMIWVDPVVVLTSTSILFVLVFSIISLTKKRLKRIGHENENYNRKVYKLVLESLHAMKDVKIFSAKEYFISKYMNARRVLSSQDIEFSLLTNITPNVINVLGFGSLLFMMLFLLGRNGSILSILPTIAIIAICIQRLLPAVTIVSNSIGLIRKYAPVVHIVSAAVNLVANDSRSSEISENDHLELINFNNNISLDSVYYKYPSAKNYSLKNISFTLEKNMSLGIVGLSGAGKSTLVDFLLGLCFRQHGIILCDGNEILSQYALRKIISYVPQSTVLIDGSIADNIAFGINQEQVDSVQLSKVIEIAQLGSWISSLKKGVNTRVGENGVMMSGGQRQRIGIARALYRDRPIIILDEATNSLDLETETAFNLALKNIMARKTTIIIAHRLSSIKFCDQIIQLQDGEIVAKGAFHELIKSSERFRHFCDLDS